MIFQKKGVIVQNQKKGKRICDAFPHRENLSIHLIFGNQFVYITSRNCMIITPYEPLHKTADQKKKNILQISNLTLDGIGNID